MPSPVDLPDPGIEAGSPALQVDSLPTELSGKSVGTAGMFILSWLAQQPYHNLSPLVADPTDTALLQE